MLPKVDYGKNGTEDSNSGQLLRDIEAISKALYLQNALPSKSLIRSSNNRSKSAGKTRLLGNKPNTKPEDVLPKDKKSSIWNWKKPLKALSHIRNRKFSCRFYLHVHSIERLPLNLNTLHLVVHWKRKDEVMHTKPSRVDQGTAEFEETLTHRCSVYGHRSGSQQSAKYEANHFLVHPSIVGAYKLDIGKYWVDLTNMLPLSLEELEEDKRSGSWKTSFKLTGKAKGAILNVSFGYSVIENTSVSTDNMVGAAVLLNINQNRSSTIENVANSGRQLRRVGSVPNLGVNHGSHLSSHSMDVKDVDEAKDVFSNQGLGISRSINLLYQKLDEAKVDNSTGFVSLTDQVQTQAQLNQDTRPMCAEVLFGNECDDIEFTVIDKGIESSTKEELTLEESSSQTLDGFIEETCDAAQIMNDIEFATNEGMKHYSKEDDSDVYNIDDVCDGYKYEENSVYTEESTMEELTLMFESLLGPESTEFNSESTLSEIPAHEISMEEKYLSENKIYMEEKSHYKATTMVRSLSFDDATESITSDFLSILGVEHSSVGLSSDSDPESPRERLLRQFEKEALASGNFIYNTDVHIEELEFNCDALTTPLLAEFPDDLEFSLIAQATGLEQKRAGPSLLNKRKAKMLEKLETEALMQEWGLNEMNFQNSPRCNSGGFGSPIYLPNEKPIGLPSLGEGLGPMLQTKSRGFVRSMNPSLFKNVKNGGSLIMQVSCPVVLPAELGSGFMEILQHLASVGVEPLSKQMSNLLPLEDITGKTMLQVAWETESKRTIFSHPESEAKQDSFLKKNETKGLEPAQFYNILHTNSLCCEASLNDFLPLAMDKIEDLSIEGLKIQSGISREEAPSSLYPRALNGDYLTLEGLQNGRESGVEVNKLLGLSMTLNEWLRLDAGIFSNEDQTNEHTQKILAAHHAKCTDLFDEKCGLLCDNLTIALMVQLRDPLRDYEPVGLSMLALFQVERAYYLPNHDMHNLPEENIYKQSEYLDGPVIRKNKDAMPKFKITESHVAGLNTEPVKRQGLGTITQQQSGYRWLLASGLGKTNKHSSLNALKSRAIVRVSSPTLAKKQPLDTLWSISSRAQGTGGEWQELAAQISHIRNPDVIFLNESIRL